MVHGRWKSRQEAIQDLPIKFCESDCLSHVETGELVYFNFLDNKASCIERASLKNFDKELIENLLKQEEKNVASSWYFDLTHISFEDLSDIIIPDNDFNNSTTSQKRDKDSIVDVIDEEYIYLIDDEDDEDDEDDFVYVSNEQTSQHLPVKIDELFECFGKYRHRVRQISFFGLSNKQSNVINKNILDLSLWTDFDFSNAPYYGTTVEEIKFLYDVFVRKEYCKENGEKEYEKVSNDCISDSWHKILSNCSDADLYEILDYAPKLQPALPRGFCKKNVSLLTDDYGMPDIEICKLYCLHKISNAQSISDYEDIKHKLFVYCDCGTKHLEGEGTPMCKMGKRRISSLKKRLELQYENVIKSKVISQLMELTEDPNVINEIQNTTQVVLCNVGMFIERCNKLKSNFLRFRVCEETLDSYKKLPQLYKDALKSFFLSCTNEAVIFATKADDLTPFSIRYNIEQFGDWILDSTKRQVKELVNERFSNLDDLKELYDAYEYDYITSEQYFRKYRQVTNNYTTHQLLNELSICRSDDYPVEVQWYIVSSIIRQLGYESLSSYKYVKIDCYDAISDIRSLLKWLNNKGYLKDIVLKKAEEKICSVLTDDERWTLFEEKIAKSPGIANIRKHLDNAYKEKNTQKELFEYECFQNVMLADIDTVEDMDIKLFIADNLDRHHHYLMRQKATGFLKLYMWQKQPSGKFDWNLVRTYFHELPVEAQIRTLRYIFGLMASGKSMLIVDDLYSEFVETATPACPAICGILFILKAKKNDINVSITSTIIESVIGKEMKQTYNFLKDSRELFYPCNGYLAITPIQQNVEYQSFNGVLTKEIKNNVLYYVITFYDSPINLFGRTIEWLDSKDVEIAEQVLTRNVDVDFVNGSYYIHESQVFFIKQFVIAYHIDDKCGLVSEKQTLIEIGFLPRNNAFQPFYTNYLRKYEDSEHYICRCGCEGGSDPDNRFPFFWCKKKICARRAHFLLPPTQWEEFCFADLLYIALGQKTDSKENVWKVNAEISQFICDYIQIFKRDNFYMGDNPFICEYSQSFQSQEIMICSKPLKESDEKGVWDKESTTYHIIDDYDDDDYYD